MKYLNSAEFPPEIRISLPGDGLLAPGSIRHCHDDQSNGKDPAVLGSVLKRCSLKDLHTDHKLLSMN